MTTLKMAPPLPLSNMNLSNELIFPVIQPSHVLLGKRWSTHEFQNYVSSSGSNKRMWGNRGRSDHQSSRGGCWRGAGLLGPDCLRMNLSSPYHPVRTLMQITTFFLKTSITLEAFHGCAMNISFIFFHFWLLSLKIFFIFLIDMFSETIPLWKQYPLLLPHLLCYSHITDCGAFFSPRVIKLYFLPHAGFTWHVLLDIKDQ